MKRPARLALLSAAAVGAAALAVRLGAQPPAAPPAAGSPRLVGVGGCAAAGCHNAGGAPGLAGSEYSTWVHDPHGRAAATLQSPRYKAILLRLRDTAYTEELCLKCHATPTAADAPPPAELLADGVGCEACHGPAERWRTVHYQGWWKQQSAEQKQAYGLYPTKDLTKRVEKCAACHVGTGNKDVNHDLIAAGHPRLTFEYTAYHHLMPPHWREKDARPDWEIHAWAVGQAVTAKAAVELLRARAQLANQPTHPWPELAEYGCFACHHDLTSESGAASWRQGRGFAGVPGSPPWGTWFRPVPEELSRWAPALAPPGGDPLMGLDALFRPTDLRSLFPPPEKVQAAADPTLQRLNDWLKHLHQSPPLSAADVRGILDRAIAGGVQHPPREWDDAAQRYLALAALYQGWSALDPASATPTRRDAFRELRATLQFPPAPDGRGRYDSPVDFTPERFRQALQRFQARFGP